MDNVGKRTPFSVDGKFQISYLHMLVNYLVISKDIRAATIWNNIVRLSAARDQSYES